MTEKEFVPSSAEVYVSNLERSQNFYQKVLGFQVIRRDESHNFISFGFNGAVYMIEQKPELVGPTKGIILRFLVDDIQSYYDQVQQNGALISKPLAIKDYGAKRFYVTDPDGYQIKFFAK